MTGRLKSGAIALAVLAGWLGTATAFDLSGESWPGPDIVMQLQLGTSSGPLLDGSASWGEAAEGALATWNAVILSANFRVVRDSTAPILYRNSFNNVYFDDNVDGDGFGGAIAVMISRRLGSEFTETDVIFNSNLDYNSYRGPLRRSSNGGTLYDIRRVALHEFGHALGLGHPDQAGQSVVAVMNSRVSDIDELQSDDIAGGQAIYGKKGSGGSSKGGGGADGTGELARLLKPGDRKVTSKNRRFTVRGVANRAAGARRIVLVNNRFRREEFRAQGVTNWRAKVDIKRGRNRIKVFAEDRDGDRTRVRTILVKRQGR